jgi:hypothetical protein
MSRKGALSTGRVSDHVEVAAQRGPRSEQAIKRSRHKPSPAHPACTAEEVAAEYLDAFEAQISTDVAEIGGEWLSNVPAHDRLVVPVRDRRPADLPERELQTLAKVRRVGTRDDEPATGSQRADELMEERLGAVVQMLDRAEGRDHVGGVVGTEAVCDHVAFDHLNTVTALHVEQLIAERTEFPEVIDVARSHSKLGAGNGEQSGAAADVVDSAAAARASAYEVDVVGHSLDSDGYEGLELGRIVANEPGEQSLGAHSP